MGHDDATCYKCGANAWTSCNHREATREKPARIDAPDKREAYVKGSGGGRYTIRPSAMQGLNFKSRKQK